MEENRWHHRPDHIFLPDCCYMVTAGMLHRERLFMTGLRLQMLHDMLLHVFAKHHWKVEAWAIFENHYHVIAFSPPTDFCLGQVINELHSVTARELNRFDGTPGRQVWFQYWDNCIWAESSYYARVRYVMQNPVKHELVQDEAAYPWGCAWWFERNMAPSQLLRIRSYKCDRIRVVEEF